MFSFAFDGVEPFEIGLTRVKHMLNDLSPLWDIVEKELEALMHEEEANQGGVGGIGGWAPLAQSTIDRYGDHPILYLTGRMFESLMQETADTIYEPGPTMMVWGTSVEYAHFHQEGTDRMPARPIFDSEALHEALNRSLAKGARELEMLWTSGRK